MSVACIDRDGVLMDCPQPQGTKDGGLCLEAHLLFIVLENAGLRPITVHCLQH